MKVFHIRKPAKPGTRRISSLRVTPTAATFCGAAATDHDIRASWDATGVGQYVCCEACIAARDAAKRSR